MNLALRTTSVFLVPTPGGILSLPVYCTFNSFFYKEFVSNT